MRHYTQKNPELHPIMNGYALSMWTALFALFLLWWVYQISLYWMKMKEWRTPYERVMQEELTEQPSWVSRLSNASNVARDSFIFLFAVAFLSSAVQANWIMSLLTWIYFGMSVAWQIGTLSTLNPNLHVVFLVLTAPFLVAIGSIALSRG